MSPLIPPKDINRIPWIKGINYLWCSHSCHTINGDVQAQGLPFAMAPDDDEKEVEGVGEPLVAPTQDVAQKTKNHALKELERVIEIGSD
jgi:hypothetical protein